MLCKIRNVPFSRPCGATGNGAAELDAVMEPSLYIGRCKEQVERLLAEYAPLLTDAQTADGAISL